MWSIGKGSEIFREYSHLFDFHLKAYYVCMHRYMKIFNSEIRLVFVECQVKT